MIKITRDEAIDRTALLKPTYMLVQINPSTSIIELAKGVAFFVEPEKEPEKEEEDPKPVEKAVEEPVEKAVEEPKPKPAKSSADHGKICACYKAGWSVAKIADECRCSDQTVRNHLKQEGLM